MKKFIGIVLFLFLFSPLFGAIYYVDASRPNDDGDGLSEGAAWKTINKVQTTLTGDQSDTIVQFKCGETWAEEYTVKGHGTSGHQFVHTSYGVGAKPVIDGGLTRTSCIILEFGEDYVTIDGFELKDTDGGNAGTISTTNVEGIIIKNCNIYHPQGRGIGISYSYGTHTVEYNLIDTTAVDNEIQNDCIYMQYGEGEGHIIQYNTFILRKTGGQYVDGVQCFRETGATIIRYNWFDYTNSTDIPGQILMVNEGDCDAYYNVFINDSGTAGCSAIKPFTSGNFNIYNNTVVCSGTNSCFDSDLTSGVSLKNNIFYTNNAICLRFISGLNTESDCDYNSYYRDTGTDIAEDDGGAKTWAQWQTAGYEPNGINVDPEFIDAANDDFRLLMASPCINAGTDVSLTRDYRGRSIRHAPDIGAYEDPTNVLFLTKLFNYIMEKRKENERN